jgi:glutathione S-transferase
MPVELYGYQYSVYAWIARFALHEKGVGYSWTEISPFAENVPESYLAKHPFKRVPVLVHDEFAVYETSAITRYVDEAFGGPDLQCEGPKERARCNQIVSIVDSYAYWPLVRQVFSHGFLRPRTGRAADSGEIRQGLGAAPRVLAALETIASEAQYLCGDRLSLADLHLAPMISYFVLAPEGRALLDGHPRLTRWWEVISQRPAYRATLPRLPQAME